MSLRAVVGRVVAQVNAQRLEPRDLVAARLFTSEDEVVQAALHHFMEARPDLRISAAVHRYATDEALTLATAAAFAGVSLWRMLDLLEEHGIAPRLGPASEAEALAEVTALKQLRHARAD